MLKPSLNRMFGSLFVRKDIGALEVVVRILVVILTVEFIIMIALSGVWYQVSALTIALIDIVALGLIASPLIYWYAFKPYQNLQQQNFDVVNRLAQIDPLTSLNNRRSFKQEINKEFLRHQRNRLPLCLLMIDIDEFKKYNDRYGHPAGDECLIQIAGVIANHANRPADMAARYGGEEFIVILPETGLPGALMIARLIQNDVASLSILHGSSSVSDRVTISIGVSCSHEAEFEEPLALINKADEYLYRAKHNGRNRIEYDSALENAGSSQGLVRLIWNDNLLSGHELIDRQHKELFDLSNQLIDKILGQSPKQDLTDDIANLVAKIETHFGDEEQILAGLGFEGLDKHHQVHDKLLQIARAFLKEYRESNISYWAFLDFLIIKVINEHLLMSDKKYFEMMRLK